MAAPTPLYLSICPAGTFRLYDDDGVSFDYEQGDYSWTRLKVTREGRSLGPDMEISNEEFFHYTRDPEWVFMTGGEK